MSGEQIFEPIFCGAIEINDPGEREEYIAEACGENVELHAQVARLVEAHFSAGSFLAEPAAISSAGEGRTEPHPKGSSLPTSTAEIGTGNKVGRYKLLQQIGEGGMGVVFMAEQVEPIRRKVALKIIKAGMDSRQVIARFEAERQALALMDHHHIARVLDAGTTDQGRPYFVMELVKGVPITEYCDKNRLTPRERLELFVPVCQAIQHAHQKGIIHRDIKPSNVLVTLYDGHPVPKVIDFGIAKATQQRLTERTMFTELGQIVGTMEYMSPEQAEVNQLDIDTRSDVYSLGVLLYELLTGTTPITKEQLQEVGYAEMLRTIRELEPPKPSTRLSESGEALPSISAVRKTEPTKLSRLLRGDLDWIVMKSLEKDRTRRYETAGSMAADIDRFLQEEAIEARPPSASYKLQKFARRNKALLATVTVIAATLLIASVISIISAIRATRAEGIANDRLIEVEQQRNEVVQQRNEKEQARQEAVTKEQEAKLARDDAKWNLYVARLFPIVDAWQRQDYGHLERMLTEMLPEEGEPDFRGWEWSYFMDQCNQAFFIIEGGEPTWNPAGHELALAVHLDEGWQIEIWSPVSRKCLQTIAIPPDDHPKGLDGPAGLKWSADGTQLAYGCRSGRVVIFDRQTGALLFEHSAVKQNMKSFDFSADGKLIATSNWLGRIEIWDVASGESVRVLQDPSRGSNLHSIAFNSDASLLAASLIWGRRTTWSLDTGEAFEYTRQAIDSGQVAWNSSGSRFATTFRDTFSIYQVGKAEPLKTLPHRTAEDVCWIGDDRIISSGGDHAIRIWDANQFKLQSEVHLHSSPVRYLAVSNNAEFLASRSYGEVKVSRLTQPVQPATILSPEAPKTGVNHFLAWEKGGRFLASGHLRIHDGIRFDTSLRIWDVNSKKLVQDETIGIIRSMAWSRDQRALWATTYRGRYYQLDLEANNADLLERYFEVGGGASSFSPDGKWLVQDGPKESSNFDQGPKQASLIDTTTLKVIRTLDLGNGTASVRWSNDSKLVAIGDWATLVIWDPFAGKVLGSQVDVAWTEITSLTWNPQNSVLALGCGDGRINIVDVKTLEDIGFLGGHSGKVHGLDWSGDGRRIASASSDGTVRIWDGATGDHLFSLGHPDEHKFYSVAWSPDGRQLAGGDNMGNVFIWGSDRIKPLPVTAKGLATGVVASRTSIATEQQLGVEPLSPLSSHAKQPPAASRTESLEKVIPLVEKTLAIRTRELGLDHTGTRATIRRLARYYVAVGKTEKAISLYIDPMSFVSGIHFAATSSNEFHQQLIKAALRQQLDSVSRPLELLVLGEVHLVAGDSNRAETAIRTAIEKGETRNFVYKCLGWCLWRQGKTEEAQQAFQEALKDRKIDDGTFALEDADPDELTAAYFLDLIGESEYIDRLTADNNKYGCIPWFYVGQRREMDGDSEAAIEAYRQSVALGKKNPHSTMVLARCRLEKLSDPSLKIQAPVAPAPGSKE